MWWDGGPGLFPLASLDDDHVGDRYVGEFVCAGVVGDVKTGLLPVTGVGVGK